MDVKTLRYLAKLMDDHGLTELDVESEELKVRLAKGGQTVVQAVSAAAPALQAAPVAAAAPAPLQPQRQHRQKNRLPVAKKSPHRFLAPFT